MRRASLISALLAIALAAAPAGARSEKTVGYPREQVWPTVVRFLVVDEKLKILEKDGDAGFATFEMKDEGKTYRGALEVVTVVRDNRTSVRFILQIEDRPDWQEVAMLNRLERKLRQELGSPTPGSPKAPPREDAPKDQPKIPPPSEGGPPISDKP